MEYGFCHGEIKVDYGEQEAWVHVFKLNIYIFELEQEILIKREKNIYLEGNQSSQLRKAILIHHKSSLLVNFRII